MEINYEGNYKEDKPDGKGILYYDNEKNYMREIIKQINGMVKDQNIMKMEINYMKEIIKKIKQMEKEYNIMKMEINYMKEVIKKINGMVKE